MRKPFKVLLRLLLLLGVVGFLIVGAAAGASMKHHRLEAAKMREKQIRTLSKIDLNYVSKRRIPNGPDPIHNRRAGNSRQPPGQA